MAWFPQIHRSHHNNKVLIFVFQDNFLAEGVVVVNFGSDSKTWGQFDGKANHSAAHFHSVAREFTESGFILYEKASRVPA